MRTLEELGITIGKWKVKDFATVIVSVKDDEYEALDYEMLDMYEFIPANAKANARLIAAAPELYEAVCWLLHYFAKYAVYDDERESVIKAMAAIKKAGGAK